MKLFIDHSIINAEKLEMCGENKKKICASGEKQLRLLVTMVIEECIRNKNDLPLVLSFTYKVGEYAVSTVSYLNGRIASLIQKNAIKEQQIDEMICHAVKELLVIFSMKSDYAKLLYEKYKDELHDKIRALRIKQCAECGTVYTSRGNDKICKGCYSQREKRYMQGIENALFKDCQALYVKEQQNKTKYCDKVYESEDEKQRVEETEPFVSSLEKKLYDLKKYYRNYKNAHQIMLLDETFMVLLSMCFEMKRLIVPEVIPAFGKRIASFMLEMKEMVEKAIGTNVKNVSEDTINLYIQLAKSLVENSVLFDDITKIGIAGAIAASIRLGRIVDAVEMVAAFDVDISADTTRNETEKWLGVDETLEEVAIDKIISDMDNFESYYSIIEKYPTSLQLFKLLMFSARWTRQYTKIMDIYSKLSELDDESNIKLSIEIMSNKLDCLVDIADSYEIKKVAEQLTEWIDNAERLGLDQEDKMICYNGVLSAYLAQKSYEDAIRLSYKLEYKCCNEKTFYLISKTYLYLGKYSEAERYCLSSIQYMNNVASSYFLLGQIYLKLERYKDAISALNKTISLINYYHRERKYKLIAENGHISTCWSLDGKEKELEQVYMYLIQGYMGAEEYNKAHAAYDIFVKEVHIADSTITSGMMLSINEKLKGKEKEIREGYDELMKAHQYKLVQISQLEKTLNGISKKLISSQIFDESQDVTDEYWEESIRNKIYGVIEELEGKANLKSEKRYKEIYEKNMKRFPKLFPDAAGYLTSAEQMYNLFEENALVDYAPVMVEYCKVVDALLWKFLRNSKEYEKEVQDNMTKARETLGSAVHIIGCQSAMGKTLHDYHANLEKIKKYRNESAHVNTSRKEKVEWVKDYLMEKSDLIDILTQ